MIQRVIDGIDQLNEYTGRMVSWLSTILVLVVCFDVISRRLLSQTQAWVMELEWHFFAVLFLFGAGYTLKHDKHVRVDLFYANYDKKDQAWVDLVGHALFLMPWTIVVMIVSFQYGFESWLINEKSPDPGGLPARYVIKFSISLGMLFLFLQSFSCFLKAYQTIKE